MDTLPRITFLIGLPASGKSHLAKTLDGVWFEDTKELPLGIDGDFILDTPDFCVVERLASARAQAISEYPYHEHRLIFFQNDPIQCLTNAVSRGDRVVSGKIRWLSQRYRPPKDAHPVYGSESYLALDESV